MDTRTSRWPVLALIAAASMAGCGSGTSAGAGDSGSADSTASSSGDSGDSGGSSGSSGSSSGGAIDSGDAGSIGPVDGGAPDAEGGQTDGDLDAQAGTDARSDGPGPPPSCGVPGDGLTNCGDGGGSCCASLEVAGGTYFRTYDFDAGSDGGTDPATVSGFRLDEYDVTVGRFRRFVSAVLPPDGGPGWLPAAGSGKHTHLNGGLGLVSGASTDAGVSYEQGWATSDNVNIAPTDANLLTGTAYYSTWTVTPGNNERLPVNTVNWWEAYAFCIWDGGFLPSEAEWECAAAGGSDQRKYPWGSAAPGTASQYAVYDCYYPGGTALACAGIASISPVGTATSGAGRWGQLDLAGNVWQWTLDAYAAYVTPCTDCAQFAGVNRVYRGGVYNSTSGLSPVERFGDGPADRNNYNGFRCARQP